MPYKFGANAFPMGATFCGFFKVASRYTKALVFVLERCHQTKPSTCQPKAMITGRYGIAQHCRAPLQIISEAEAEARGRETEDRPLKRLKHSA